MNDSTHPSSERSAELADEIRNFREIARHFNPSPGELPKIPGIEIAGLTIPLHDGLGGDHIVYVDFAKRYDLQGRADAARARGDSELADTVVKNETRAGVLLADVSGHRMTDALISLMLHQAFLLGVRYELELYGEVTTGIFENINTRFYRTTAFHKYFTMVYGEIATDGTFRFLSAGHPQPAVFSREYGRFMEIHRDWLVSFPPVGMLPTSGDPEERVGGKIDRFKKRYQVNELNLLSPGDTLLLYTDGLAEHDEGRYFPSCVETLLAESTTNSAGALCKQLREDILAKAKPTDDISVVVIRRTS